jgi:hypothetical protein
LPFRFSSSSSSAWIWASILAPLLGSLPCIFAFLNGECQHRPRRQRRELLEANLVHRRGMICCFRSLLTLIRSMSIPHITDECWNGKSMKAWLKHEMSRLPATLDLPSTLLSPHCRYCPLPFLAALYQYSSILICSIPTFSSRANLLAIVLPSSNRNFLELLSQSASTGFTYLNHWPCGYAPFPHGICCPSSPGRFEIGGRSSGPRPRRR